MKPHSSLVTSIQGIAQVSIRIIVMLILVSSVSCNFIARDNDQESLEITQTALSAVQTDMAEESGDDMNATIAAQQATIDAQAAQATQAAIQATQLAPPPGTTPLAPPAAPPGTTPMAPPAPPSGDFNQMMKSASILLFEDIIAIPSQARYVKNTLDTMGLNYKDDGNAIGWLKSDMLGGAPGGKPWDLVIIAEEARGEVSGEFYKYLSDLLQQGTSVILEAWDLDDVSEGAIAPTLAKCGVMAYPYFAMTGSVNDVLMWPLGIPHPVLSQPNSGLTFTRARDTWLWFGDLGFKMALTGRGDAVLLLGTKAEEKYQDGTLAVCMGGRLILQGFSSHNFGSDVMYPLWENYIYNALQVRLLGGS